MIISKLFEEQFILSFLTLPRSTPFARVPKSKVLQVSETCSASGEIYIQILLNKPIVILLQRLFNTWAMKTNLLPGFKLPIKR